MTVHVPTLRCLPVLVLAAALAAQTPTPPAANVPEPKLVHRLPFGKDGLPAVTAHAYGTSLLRLCWQGDGSRLLLSHTDGFDPKTRGPRYRLAAIDAAGTVADATPADGAQCLAASRHGPLLLGGGELRAEAAPDSKPYVVGDRADAWLSPFSLHAVVTTMERGLATKLVDLRSGEATSLKMTRTFPAAVAFAPDGRLAIARAQAAEGGDLSNDGIVVLDAEGARLLDLPGRGGPITAIAFAAGGTRIVFADGRLHLVEVDGGKELASSDLDVRFWAPLGDHAAVGHDGTVLRLHDPATLEPQRELPIEAKVPEGVPRRQADRGPLLLAAVSPDGTKFAVATYDALHVFAVEQR
jgi:hypothetical protein